MATTMDKEASMLPPTEDAFKQHVLRANYQTRIWCNSHIANQEETPPVGHGWSACDDGGITPTMFSKPPAPVEVRDLTHLYCKDKDCSNGRKCPCQLAGLNCIDACSCREYQNQNNTPAGQDKMRLTRRHKGQFWALSQTRGNMPHCINFASLIVSFASVGYAGKGTEVGLTLIQYLLGVGFGTICPTRPKVTNFSVLMVFFLTLQPLD